MDPLSICLGLLPLVVGLVKIAKKYRETVKGAEESVAALEIELEALRSALGNLKEFLCRETNAEIPALGCCLDICQTKLRSLQDKLINELEPSSQKTNPFSRRPVREAQKTLQEIKTFTLWIQFAISIDTVRLLSSAADGVDQLLAGQSQQLEILGSIDTTTKEALTVLNAHVSRLEEHQTSAEGRQLLDRICTFDHDEKNRKTRAGRVPETGLWLLQHEKYRGWRDGSSESNVLWCYGHPGTGKTVLT